MAAAAHYDVIDSGDFEQLSGATQLTGAPDVRIGWLRIPRWDLHQEDPMGGGNDGLSVDFPTLHEEAIQRADRVQLMALHSSSGVEQEHQLHFLLLAPPRLL